MEKQQVVDRAMKQRHSRHVRSKWTKTQAIIRNPELRQYVPDTRRLSLNSLQRMLKRYPAVYVKPDAGTYGHGVMRIGRTRNRAYECRSLDRVQKWPQLASVYRHIRARSGGRPYLAQQGIPLMRWKGRVFDIRVMVQKNASKRWETTGMIGRVARPAYIVTNYHSGGKPTDIHTLLSPRMKPAQIRALESRMSRISRKAAIALGRKYPGVNMVGADIGLDERRRCWIIELNTSPDPYLFRFLKDKRVSRKVLRYARALRRIP